MAEAKSLAMVLTPEIEPASLDEWVANCDRALAGGAMTLTLYGRVDATGRVVTTAVLLANHGSIEILRGNGVSNQRYRSLTPSHPAVHMFERELWEQTGLVPQGHPWLKPVRYEGARQQQMHEHPFFTVRGREIHEVGVGPIHASVIEPGHFRFMCHGETVHHLEIQLGYQHRGVEALLLRRHPLALAPLVETIAGDSSIAYAWGYCAAVEALSGTQVNLQTDIVRGIALELERIGMHLVALTGLATDIAFLQGGATYGRLRTAIINATMRVCGSRFGRGWLRPGGARFGINDARREDLVQTIAGLLKDMAEVNELMLGARSVKARFQGVGTVDAQAARDIGLTGLVARASGLPQDLRTSLPGKLYAAYPIPTLVEDTGDCWARLRLRMREAEASARWIAKALQVPDLRLPPHQAATPGRLWPQALCVSIREGFRGPVVQALETGADGNLLHYKVQDPSMQNWYGLALALRENEISDFPICNKSFDLSYCGNDL